MYVDCRVISISRTVSDLEASIIEVQAPCPRFVGSFQSPHSQTRNYGYFGLGSYDSLKNVTSVYSDVKRIC